MTVLLVRHAAALDRASWEDDDALRPLSKKGRRQAAALVAQLSSFPVDRVLSSPALRCVDTVAPLAAARGVRVEPADDLAEGCGARAVGLVRSLAGDHAVVLCTHGDVVGDVLDALEDDGARLPGADRCQKGSTWLLEADGTGGDRAGAVRGRYLPPPA